MTQGLKLKNISKSFGDTSIINSLDLDVASDEFVVLVGPSGSGKSTIIRMIAGLEKEDTGSINLNGKDIENDDPKDRDLSMVFQSYALYPHKTIFDNIAFPLLMAKKDKAFIKDKVHQLAKKLEIADYLERKPNQLSGGQKQRVALARAMIKEPKLFLMDEPLSNLDAKLRTQMRTVINSLHKELKNMFIYVTHDQVEALTLGDRIVVLDQGDIQQIDSPHEIYNNPANTFVATFIGSPPCNLLLENDKVLGIRPEFLSLDKNNHDKEIKVEVQNIELLGGEYLVHGKLSDSNYKVYENETVIARIDAAQNSLSENDKSISLYFDSSKAYYFDKASKARI